MMQLGPNFSALQELEVMARRYATADITADVFARELSRLMSPDVAFRSNYTPSWEPLRPLFATCRGIDAIIARYDYEQAHEIIEDGSSMPFDLVASGDVACWAQRETARFFDGPAVTWDMVTKTSFRDGLIADIWMFLDPSPIERAYPADAI